VTFGEYLFGVIGLAAVAIPMGMGGLRLRRRLLPGWNGAPARLAETVLAVALLTVLLELLGAVGILVPAVLIPAALLVGLGVYYGMDGAFLGHTTSKTPRTGFAAPPAPAIPLPQTILALAAAVFVAAHWATGLQDVWERGMLTFDTLWYHGPFAARIADTGSVWGMHFTDPQYLNWFYPENSELFHAAGIVLFDRDIFSPLVNFGWLGVSLLAAWCIGRPYGVAPLSLVAVCIAMVTGPMVPREAGTPATDTVPVAMVLAAAAILINAWAARESRPAGAPPKGGPAGTPSEAGGSHIETTTMTRRGSPAGPPSAAPLMGALLVAGLAIGIGLGSKLTIWGVAVAFAVGAPFLVPRELRWKAFWVFVGGVAAVAAFWFLRNLIHSGNPLPWIREIGPIELPGPNRGLEGRDNFTVAHYIFVDPDTGLWRQYFLNPIENLLGPLWFLILGGAAGGAILALWRPRSPAVRLAGAVTVVAAIAYLFTPLSAAGPEGRPLAFGINLRYLIPGFALGLALLPLERRLVPDRFRVALLVGGLIALYFTSRNSDANVAWEGEFASVPWAIVIGLVMIGGPLILALLAGRGPWLAAGAGAVLALAVAAVGWERQDDYFDHRYERSDDFRFQLDEAVRWANPTSDLRIGLAGTSGAFNQYGLYGDDLSNYVQYVGRNLPEADFRAITTCPAFREAVNEGDYDYLVTTPELDLNDPSTARPSPERGWVSGDPAVTELLRSGRVAVFRIEGELTPSGCSTGTNLRSETRQPGGSAAKKP
jgi:dolichol kinase